jgi:predicted O-linked N-acetylglucosamine transferase (SPINDLY family)
MLTRVGLRDLVAASPQTYVEAAARLAADRPALARPRADLRNRIANSPLCDGARFTRQREAAYRTMWREWCGRGSAGHV